MDRNWMKERDYQKEWWNIGRRDDLIWTIENKMGEEVKKWKWEGYMIGKKKGGGWLGFTTKFLLNKSED